LYSIVQTAEQAVQFNDTPVQNNDQIYIKSVLFVRVSPLLGRTGESAPGADSPFFKLLIYMYFVIYTILTLIRDAFILALKGCRASLDRLVCTSRKNFARTNKS